DPLHEPLQPDGVRAAGGAPARAGRDRREARPRCRGGSGVREVHALDRHDHERRQPPRPPRPHRRLLQLPQELLAARLARGLPRRAGGDHRAPAQRRDLGEPARQPHHAGGGDRGARGPAGLGAGDDPAVSRGAEPADRGPRRRPRDRRRRPGDGGNDGLPERHRARASGRRGGGDADGRVRDHDRPRPVLRPGGRARGAPAHRVRPRAGPPGAVFAGGRDAQARVRGDPRPLSGAAVTGRPAADPFTLQVVQSYLTSTVREMMRTTKASAHSVVFAEGEDFTCAITAPDGRLTFQAEGLGLHAATFPAAIRLVLEHYDSFEPGDVFFHNDPYRGGAHQADGAFARPVFHGEQLVAWVANRGHWSDVGGMSAGGWAGSATHVLQEALLVPPVRLWKGGVLDDELRRFVLANVRNPDDAWGTILAQISSLTTAEERIHGLIERHGLGTFKAATHADLDYARKRFLAALRKLPGGEWSAEDF